MTMVHALIADIALWSLTMNWQLDNPLARRFDPDEFRNSHSNPTGCHLAEVLRENKICKNRVFNLCNPG